MAHKGLDSTFVHHGIRKDDMKMLEKIAVTYEIDSSWLKELMQSFHEKKTKNPEIEDKEITRLIEDYLNKL